MVFLTLYSKLRGNHFSMNADQPAESCGGIKMTITDCIFCKIIAGEIPSTRIYEDEKFFAFMDINPLTKGHCLLIPKEHHATLHDMPDDLLQGLIIVAKRLAGAAAKGLKAEGINLIQSNGRAANQIIDHYHMHIIPRWASSEVNFAAWEMIPGDLEEIKKAAEEIKRAI